MTRISLWFNFLGSEVPREDKRREKSNPTKIGKSPEILRCTFPKGLNLKFRLGEKDMRSEQIIRRKNHRNKQKYYS